MNNRFPHLKFSILLGVFLLVYSGCEKINDLKEGLNYIDSDTVKYVNSNDEDVDSFSVIGVGDIMMGSNYPVNSLPPNDGIDLFSDVENYLWDANITFGNLEGPLLDRGGTPKICEPESHCVAFRMPERYAGYIKKAGFDIVSIANNHANDMGKEGRESTQKTLDEYEIGYTGQTDCPVYKFERKGMKIGFVAFSPSVNTCSINDIDKAEDIVSDLSKEVDIVIISFHGGAEGASSQHITRHREFFLGEDRGNVYEFAHSMIDAGASIIFGHGPHVARAVEIYKGKFIAYSLGNFCTYAKFGLNGVLGIAPMMKVFIDENGKFLKGEIIPVKQIKRGIPVIDENKTVIKVIKKLTEEDFPDSKLLIDDDGNITLNE